MQNIEITFNQFPVKIQALTETMYLQIRFLKKHLP
jgi:hypothetical protein